MTEQLASALETIAKLKAALAKASKSSPAEDTTVLGGMRIDGVGMAAAGPSAAEYKALQDRLTAVMQ